MDNDYEHVAGRAAMVVAAGGLLYSIAFVAFVATEARAAAYVTDVLLLGAAALAGLVVNPLLYFRIGRELASPVDFVAVQPAQPA